LQKLDFRTEYRLVHQLTLSLRCNHWKI